MKYYKKTIAALVFIAVFSTVAPARALAVDTATIINAVYSVHTTGGQSGADGKDGQDGQDGKDGQDGQSVSGGSSVISGKSTASIHIESTSNGEKVVDIHKTKVLENGEPTVTHVVASSDALVHDELSTSESDIVLIDDNVQGFWQALTSIRLMLLSYVGLLF